MMAEIILTLVAIVFTWFFAYTFHFLYTNSVSFIDIEEE